MYVPQKLKLGTAIWSAIPPLHIYMEKTLIWKDTCVPMLRAAIFKIARTWKQPKCPSKDEWIKKMWYEYTIEYDSTIKKSAICSYMGGPRDYYTKQSKSEKDKYHTISLICEILKIIQMSIFTKQIYRHRKQTSLPKGKGSRRDEWAVWNQQIQVTMCTIDNQKGFTM